jgi:hypothetical protein
MSETKARKPFWKRWWFWIIVVIVIGAAAAGSGGNNDDNKKAEKSEDKAVTTTADTSKTSDKSVDTTSKTKSSNSDTKTEKPSKPSAPTIEDGVHLVGEDIQPGIYKSDGNVSYWARLKDTSGGLDSIIANGDPSGVVYVEIKKSDKAFQTQGGTWTKIDLNKYKGEKQDKYTDGIYLVGKDIDPGQYKYEVTGGLGYWARLKNVAGDMDSIIANDNPQGPGYVTINKSDFAIEIKGLTLTKK